MEFFVWRVYIYKLYFVDGEKCYLWENIVDYFCVVVIYYLNYIYKYDFLLLFVIIFKW